MGKRLVKNVMTGMAILSALGISATPVFAAIPAGTVVFGDGKAYDLNYANDPANAAVISSEVVGGSKIWVDNFGGQLIDNLSGLIVPDGSAPATLTYTDVHGTPTPITNVSVASVSAINVTTAVGTAPVLPATVTATMNDGTTTTPAVTWAAVTASQYAAAGTFAVTGTIANSTVTATANVTVTAGPAVSSIGAITATTVKAVLTTAPTTAYTVANASLFTVLVNGTAVVPTAIAADPTDATGKTYVLTIPTLANTQGTLTVNGTAPVNVNGGTTTGSANNFDFAAPTVASVTGVNATTVTVVFNEKVTSTTAQSTANYTLTKIVGTAPTIASAVLAADGKTVTLTYGAMNNATNGYSLNVAGVKDIAGNAIASTDTIFSGVATADTTTPAVNTVNYDSNYKTVTIQFTKPISLLAADVTLADFVLTGTGTGQSLALTNATFTATSTPSNTVTLTLTTADNTTLSGFTGVTMSTLAGGVKDTSTTPIANAVQTSVAVTTSTSPQVTAASYLQNTNILNLTLASTPTTVDLTKVTVNSHTLTSADTYVVSGNNVAITLASSHNAWITAAGQKVTTVASAFTTAAGVANAADATGVALTFTADTTAPTLVSAGYNDLTHYLTLTFSKPMSTTINMSGLVLKAGTTTLLTGDTNDVAVTQANNKVIVINMASDTEVSALEADTVNRSAIVATYAAGTFQDTVGNAIAANTAGQSVAYTDLTAPSVSIRATTASGALLGDSTTADDGTMIDSIHISVPFTGQVLASTATNTSNYTVVLNSNTNVSIPVSSAVITADNKTVVLTVPDVSAYAGQLLRVKVSNNVTDAAGNKVSGPTNSDGSTYGYIYAASIAPSTTGPTISSVTFKDTDTSGSVSAGDKLVMTFSAPITINGTITADQFVLPTGKTFGSGATFAADTTNLSNGSASSSLVITLGAGANLVVTGTTSTVNIISTGTSQITDVLGNKVAAATSPVSITAITGTAPTISSITYTDTNGDGTVNAGDKFAIVYSNTILVPGLATLSASDFTLGSSLNFGTTPTFAFDGNKTITVTLGGTGMSVGSFSGTIDEAASAKITDVWGTAQVAGDGILSTIAKSDTTSPYIVSAGFSNLDGSSGAAVTAGDQIILTFSKAVNLGTMTDGDLYINNGGTLKDLVLTGGANFVATQPVTDKKVVVLNFLGTGSYYVSPGTTAISVKVGGTSDISDANSNGAVQSASPIVIASTSSVVSSNKALSFPAAVVPVGTNNRANYVSTANTTAEFDVNSANATTTSDKLFLTVTSATGNILTANTSAGSSTTNQAITSFDISSLTDGNLTVKGLMYDAAAGEFTPLVTTSSVKLDVLAPTVALSTTSSALTMVNVNLLGTTGLFYSHNAPTSSDRLTAVATSGDIKSKLTVTGTNASTDLTSVTWNGTSLTVNHGAGTSGDTIVINLNQFADAAGNPVIATPTITLTNTSGTWTSALS